MSIFATEQMPKEHTSKKQKNCITIAILKLVEGGKTAAYLGVCEHFDDKPDAKRAYL